MERAALVNGGWFDPARADSWDEETYHDGQHRISRATGSQWHHERLYRTASGAWVLHHWSQWQGSRETYRRISAAEAAEWCARNEMNDDDIPAGLAADVAALEI